MQYFFAVLSPASIIEGQSCAQIIHLPWLHRELKGKVISSKRSGDIQRKRSHHILLVLHPKKVPPNFLLLFGKWYQHFMGRETKFICASTLVSSLPGKKRSKKDFFKDLFHLLDQRPSPPNGPLFKGSFCGLSFFHEDKKT